MNNIVPRYMQEKLPRSVYHPQRDLLESYTYNFDQAKKVMDDFLDLE